MSKPFNPLRRITIERAKKKKRIEEEWAKTGKADNLIQKIRKKRKDHPSAKELPF